MQNFQPIYIYAQSLDNSSEDLIYQILHKEKAMVEQIHDLSFAQSIMLEINAAIRARNITSHLSNFVKNYTNLDIAIHKNSSKVLIKLKTNDKDNIGRHSPISVLLDTTNLTSNNAEDYIDYFHHGLIEFCRITGRQPKNADFIKDPAPPNTKTKCNTYKPNNKWLKTVVIDGVIIGVILIIILLLKHYIYQ